MTRYNKSAKFGKLLRLILTRTPILRFNLVYINRVSSKNNLFIRTGSRFIKKFYFLKATRKLLVKNATLRTMNTLDKQTEWHIALEQVKQITDRFGMPMDEGIIETVAIMQLMGIHTTMSCEGHPERQTGGPYIMFVSSIAEESRKEAAVIHNTVNPQYKALYKKAMQANLTEQQKLYQMLDNFYKSHDASFSQRLILHTMGFSACRLECQGADMAYILDKNKQIELLMKNQAEMKTFTEFLKVKYFTG